MRERCAEDSENGNEITETGQAAEKGTECMEKMNVEVQELIRIRWHVDREKDPPVYMLVCEDPVHPDLQVSVSSAEMTERVAKAKLMEAMYSLGKDKGIPPQRLRFKINGIEE